MRDYTVTYLYENNSKNIYKNENIIFISPFQIRKIIQTKHLYFDGKFCLS